MKVYPIYYYYDNHEFLLYCVESYVEAERLCKKLNDDIDKAKKLKSWANHEYGKLYIKFMDLYPDQDMEDYNELELSEMLNISYEYINKIYQYTDDIIPNIYFVGVCCELVSSVEDLPNIEEDIKFIENGNNNQI